MTRFKAFVTQIANEHPALVMMSVIVAIFGSIALVGPSPPPRPPEIVTLTPADRKLLAEAIVTALRDGGNE